MLKLIPKSYVPSRHEYQANDDYPLRTSVSHNHLLAVMTSLSLPRFFGNHGYPHLSCPLANSYFVPDDTGLLRILDEQEWRGIGITQSLGWEHFEVHGELYFLHQSSRFFMG